MSDPRLRLESGEILYSTAHRGVPASCFWPEEDLSIYCASMYKLRISRFERSKEELNFDLTRHLFNAALNW